MNNAMTVIFQLKVTKQNAAGKAPIYCRITIGGRRTEFATKQYVDPKKWIAKAGLVKGTTEESKSLNATLTSIRLKLSEHYRALLDARKPLTPEGIKDAYHGLSDRGKFIVEVYRYHNDKMRELVGKDYAAGTLERYETSLKHTQQYIQWKYGADDLAVARIDAEFLSDYEFYFKTVRRCSHNTTIKYITNFKKIVLLCLRRNWLEKNPFLNFKLTLRRVKRDPLTEEQLQALADKPFTAPRLEQVRDIFLFCCYTGLAYADVKKLSREHIVLGMEGSRMIKLNRTKSDTEACIPLLPRALGIIEKYAEHPKCTAEGRLLPVLSNQKMNGYLKELADVCGISQNITSHLARHTFATTVTLSNDVPIETVSRMLGHRSIHMTEHYAKIQDRKVCKDMKSLQEKLDRQATAMEAVRRFGS